MSADPDRELLAASLAFASATVVGSAVAIREQLPGQPCGITFRCRSRQGCWLAGGLVLPHRGRCLWRRSSRQSGPGAPNQAR